MIKTNKTVTDALVSHLEFLTNENRELCKKLAAMEKYQDLLQKDFENECESAYNIEQNLKREQAKNKKLSKLVFSCAQMQIDSHLLETDYLKDTIDSYAIFAEVLYTDDNSETCIINFSSSRKNLEAFLDKVFATPYNLKLEDLDISITDYD